MEQSEFELHWSVVESPAARRLAAPGCTLIALWPAPVNCDACFEAAGFRHFADNGDEWDARATALVARIVEQLSDYGEPRLVGPPLRDDLPWYQRPFREAPPLPLMAQIEQPMHWDSLPTCHVAFGESGAALWAGSGHVLMWVSLPDSPACSPRSFAERAAAGVPLFETSLDWQHLLGWQGDS